MTSRRQVSGPRGPGLKLQQVTRDRDTARVIGFRLSVIGLQLISVTDNR